MKALILTLLLFPLSLPGEVEAVWEEKFLPMMEHYCFDCHGDGMDKGGINLDGFKTVANMQESRALWLKIEKNLHLNLMPPLDEEQLETEEREALLEWIDEAVFPVEEVLPGPGLVRRLNRVEYENTVNDLLGTQVSLKGILPPDDTGYGYDNISDVLTLSPTHLDKFFQTAEIALEEAFSLTHKPQSRTFKYSGQDGGVGIDVRNIISFPKNGRIHAEYYFPAPGDYEIHITASGLINEEGVPPLMEFHFQGKFLRSYFITNAFFHEDLKVYKERVSITKAGKKKISLSLINRPNTTLEDSEAGQMRIYRSEIKGPYPPADTAPYAYRRLVGDVKKFPKRKVYYEAQLERFLYRAFRRPPSPDEVDKYVSLALGLEKEGAGHKEALRSTALAVLVSPSFLYREGHESAEAESVQQVDEFTLASRLSYFLWSSMPDKTLFQLAEKGELRASLDTQIDRMLASPKSAAFIQNYVGQWLQLRDVPLFTHSRKDFPEFDHKLQGHMKKETELLLLDLLHGNKPLIQLLSADYTFVNPALGKHYGMKGLKGKDFRRVSVKDPARHGILGHGSFQILTSHPNRTSPVLRGKYVLENLLDLSPPPPPQDANQITEGKILQHHTLRQQLEMHRQDPSCASCHNLMDPIGFGLESFSAIGQKRESYPDGNAILTYGSLYRGEIFHDAVSLREQLVEHYEEEFYTAAVKNLLIYATGRGLEWYDRATVKDLLATSKENEGRFRDIIKSVIHSVPFQSRTSKLHPE